MATTVHAPQTPQTAACTHRFSYLLAAELLLILGFPLLQHLEMGLYGFLGIGVFGTALYAVFGEGKLTAIAFLLGIPAIVGNLLASFGHTRVFFIPGLVFGTLFLIFVTAVILKSVVAAAQVTMETLYGSIAGYVLLGLTWGGIFFLINSVRPVAFHSTVAPGAAISWPDFMFFSFVTLTTIGYGDIVPVSAIAKSIVILEAVTGIMYPAVMIARLVALHSAGTRER